MRIHTDERPVRLEHTIHFLERPRHERLVFAASSRFVSTVPGWLGNRFTAFWCEGCREVLREEVSDGPTGPDIKEVGEVRVRDVVVVGRISYDRVEEVRLERQFRRGPADYGCGLTLPNFGDRCPDILHTGNPACRLW